MKFTLASLGGALTLVAALDVHAQSQAPLPRPGEATVYGIMAVDVLRVTNVYNGATASTQNRVDNSTPVASRLGFKGAEDLGSGLSAIYNLESGVAPDTGTSNAAGFWNRGSWVGLSDRTWGTLTIGRQWNLEDRVLGRYFMFAGYSAFKYTEFAAIDDLVNNAVKYVSPTLYGIEVSALAAPGEGTTGRTVELGVNVVQGPFEIGGTYRSAKGLNGEVDKLISGGASFTIGAGLRVHGGYSHADPKASVLPQVNAYDVGVIWEVTPLFITAFDYIARDQVGTDNDSHFARLQGNYFLSKRTALYANIVLLRNKGSASQRFVGTGAPGQGQDVYGVGLRHSF